MKPILAAILSLSISVSFAAEQDLNPKPAQVLEIFPNGAPHEEGQTVGEETWTPSKDGKTIGASNVTRPTLSLYPATGEGIKPAVLVFPGGGYSHLAMTHEGSMVAEWLNKEGFSAAVLKYRVPRRQGRLPHEAPLEDARKALELMHQNAQAWKLDPERIGVLGFSAGGNLVAHVAYGKGVLELPAEQRPDFAVLVYPAYLLTDDKTTLVPDFEVKAGSPKAFFVHAYDDRTVAHVDGSARLFLALSAQNVSSEMHIYTKGGHGFGMRESALPVSSWPARCADWLKLEFNKAK